LYVAAGLTIIDGLSTFNTMVLVYVFAPRHQRPNLGLSRLQVARFALLSWVTIVQSGVAITAFVMVDQSLWGLVAVTPLIIMAGRWHQTNQRLNTQRLRDETIQFLLGSTQSAGTTNEAIRQLIDAMIDQSRASFSVIAVESLDQPIVVVKTNEDEVASDEALEDHVALFDCWSATQSVQIVECTTPIESVANYLNQHRLARIMLASSMINDQRCVVCLGYARFDDESFDSIDQTGLATIAGALAAVLRVGSLANSVDELETQHWLMWQQANHDVLTGVANRLRFNDLLNHALLRRTPNLAVIYLDLDNLKTVNDTYGHEAGDQLLVRAARYLADSVRQEDTVARLGGDEFAIILENITPQDAEALSARLVEGFREIYDSPDGPILATVSAGYAYANTNESASQLVARADKALFQAKQTGRARLVIANS
jgi:diguanylate cyclase (GGDEF)-like protein